MAQSLLYYQARQLDNRTIIMMDIDEKDVFDIQLKEDATGKNRVVITIKASTDSELDLTSHQARVIATELIMAANRAEVRENLKRKEHLVRSSTNVGERRSLLQYVLQNNLITRPDWRG